MRKLLYFIFFIVLVAVTGFGYFGYSWWTRPIASTGESTIVAVDKGEPFVRVAEKLQQVYGLEYPEVLARYAQYTGLDKQVKAGEYLLPEGLSPQGLLTELVKGQVRLVSVSYPEGFNIYQVQEVLEKAFPHINKQEWKAAFNNPERLAELSVEGKNLEGYLFPDTYKIRRGAQANEVLDMITENFKKKIPDSLLKKGEEWGLNPYEVLTLASIIEKETGIGEERPQISSVFHNRIKKGMKLQTDPTVIYGMWERYDGNIRKKDLLTPTAYNTYTIPGLPPGPIANPGVKAVEAAVQPDTTPYLYFVAFSDGSGRHYFSKNLKEHNQAVYKYQIAPHRKKKGKK